MFELPIVGFKEKVASSFSELCISLSVSVKLTAGNEYCLPQLH